jgi:hypothetical protein
MPLLDVSRLNAHGAARFGEFALSWLISLIVWGAMPAW